jgi:aminoglycoside 6'-N-acetyltransferase
MENLREHNVRLANGNIVLRPMTEHDWSLLLKWNSDPEVLYYTEGDDVSSYSLEDVQAIYRGVSQHAFCFIIELNGLPIGECWLQELNLERLLTRFPGKDCRRIDLMIGEKEYWGKGIGTEVIRMLTRFGFERENADVIFGLVESHNPRSRRAFEKSGYMLYEEIKSDSPKSEVAWDLIITRAMFEGKVR